MSATTADKVKKLADLYSPERVEKIRRRIGLFWNAGSEERLLFTLRRRDVPLGLNHNEYELGVFSYEEVLSAQLDDRILKASLSDYYVPSLITGNSPYYLSIAVGAEWKRMGRDGLVSSPPIRSSSELNELKLPDFARLSESPFTRCLERMEYFLEKSRGVLPLSLPDPQGPMSLAAQLWNQEDFFISMAEDPESVHRMMEFCTEVTTAFYNYLFNRFGRAKFITVHCQPYLYRKEGEGISLSEDMIGVLSPGQLKEFLVPYLNRIADEFGPLVIHSCGDCRRKFRVIREVTNLAGVNFGQTDISSVPQGEIGGLCLLSPGDWTSRGHIADYVRVLKEKGTRGWIQVHTLGKEIDQEAAAKGYGQWADLADYLRKICRWNDLGRKQRPGLRFS